MDLIIKISSLLIIAFTGLLANKLDEHLEPKIITKPILFNIGKLISYLFMGIILGLLGFLIKISGSFGGLLLLVFASGIIIVTISHLPIFPKIVVLGLQSHHHSKKPFIAGITNIFASSATLHIIMIVALAQGYFLDSGIIMLSFVIGSLYIPKNIHPNKVLKILQGILFIIFALFTVQKGLLYMEKFHFSPFEESKTAVVPEVLNNQQFLKTDTNQLGNRILMGRGLDLNWMIVGNKKGDVIYIPRFRHRSTLNSEYQSLSINAKESGFIYFTGTLGKGDYIIKVIDNIIDVYSLPYKKVLDSGYGDDIHGEDYIPETNNIPNIKITEPGIATLVDGKQNIDIIVDKDGYSPSVIVLKKGIPTVMNFRVKELTPENKRIVMPSYNEYLEFADGDNPINIPEPLIDFIFYSWKGEHGGYILVVDELSDMTKEMAERQIRMLNVNGI